MRVTTGLFLVLLASCDVGGGSQLAPFIGRLPSRWLAGIVQSAAGQSIVGAVVRLSGSSSTAVSARSGRFVFFDPPLGTRVLSVDASAATATGTDLFGSLQIIVDVPGGTSELGRPLVLADINSLGYKSIVYKTGQENAITALVRAVKAAWDGDLVIEMAPKGDSQANGAAESAV